MATAKKGELAVPLEQRHAKFTLELTDAARDRRLRKLQVAGIAPKTDALSRRDDISNVMHLHADASPVS